MYPVAHVLSTHTGPFKYTSFAAIIMGTPYVSILSTGSTDIGTWPWLTKEMTGRTDTETHEKLLTKSQRQELGPKP